MVFRWQYFDWPLGKDFPFQEEILHLLFLITFVSSITSITIFSTTPNHIQIFKSSSCTINLMTSMMYTAWFVVIWRLASAPGVISFSTVLSSLRPGPIQYFSLYNSHVINCMETFITPNMTQNIYLVFKYNSNLLGTIVKSSSLVLCVGTIFVDSVYICILCHSIAIPVQDWLSLVSVLVTNWLTRNSHFCSLCNLLRWTLNSCGTLLPLPGAFFWLCPVILSKMPCF